MGPTGSGKSNVHILPMGPPSTTQSILTVHQRRYKTEEDTGGTQTRVLYFRCYSRSMRSSQKRAWWSLRPCRYTRLQ